MELLPESYTLDQTAEESIQRTILERGTAWPWISGDPSIASLGIIGDARKATPDLGHRIVESVVAEYGKVLSRLIARSRG